MYADVALPAEAVDAIAAHLASCPTCQTQLEAMRAEAQRIVMAIQMETPEDAVEFVVPKFSRPLSLRGFALANIATALTIWLAQFLWKTLFGEVIVNVASWATSVYLPDIYEVASATAMYFLEEGMAMLDAYLGFVVATILTFTVITLLLIHRKAQATLCVCLLSLGVGAVMLPPPANALDIRRDDSVLTIAQTETIDDTLIAAAQTVLIEGTVTGDVIAVGQKVDIAGTIEGNLITFAETIKVRGKVGGFALGAGSTYTLSGATVNGDLWAAGEKVTVDGDARINRNATLAGETATVDGKVAKDLHAFAETIELSGDLGRHLEAFGERLQLLGEAHVGGDVRFHTSDSEQLYRADTVRVDGSVDFLDMPEQLVEENRYTTIEFYLWTLAQLIAAFIVGLTLLWLVPGLRPLSIGAGTDGLKSAGIGFLALVSIPIMAIIVAITIVGLPISVAAIFAWLAGLYLAKILIGAMIGRMLLSESDNIAMPLLVGLVIVAIAVNLPLVGGIVNFLLTIIGLGLLVQYLYRMLPAGGRGDTAAG